MPPRQVDDVIRAAEVCPGECIFIEIDAHADAHIDAEVDVKIAARIDLRDDDAGDGIDDEAAA